MRDKIKPLNEAVMMREYAADHYKVVVFTNGCFDILHPGHVDYLEAAKKEGDLLIVGLNSDKSITKIKGEGRPIIPQEDRAAVLAGLQAVDLVVIFDEDDPFFIIKSLMPDVLVKGADWKEDEIIGGDVVKAEGGLIVRIPLTADRSTSSIINKILNTNKNK